jgi:hypothetical protein
MVAAIPLPPGGRLVDHLEANHSPAGEPGADLIITPERQCLMDRLIDIVAFIPVSDLGPILPVPRADQEGTFDAEPLQGSLHPLRSERITTDSHLYEPESGSSIHFLDRNANRPPL